MSPLPEKENDPHEKIFLQNGKLYFITPRNKVKRIRKINFPYSFEDNSFFVEVICGESKKRFRIRCDDDVTPQVCKDYFENRFPGIDLDVYFAREI